MSAFAVFGMTRPAAVVLARQRIARHAVRSIQDEMLEAQYEQAVADLADKIMQSSETAQLSDKFDAPQFAAEFKRLCERTTDYRDLQVMAYVTLHGETPTGKKKHEWQPVAP